MVHYIFCRHDDNDVINKYDMYMYSVCHVNVLTIDSHIYEVNLHRLPVFHDGTLYMYMYIICSDLILLNLEHELLQVHVRTQSTANIYTNTNKLVY